MMKSKASYKSILSMSYLSSRNLCTFMYIGRQCTGTHQFKPYPMAELTSLCVAIYISDTELRRRI